MPRCLCGGRSNCQPCNHHTHLVPVAHEDEGLHNCAPQAWVEHRVLFFQQRHQLGTKSRRGPRVAFAHLEWQPRERAGGGEHGQACLVVPVLQVGVRYPGHALLSPPTADKALATKLTRWVGTGHQVRHGALQPWVKAPWPRSTCSINSSL